MLLHTQKLLYDRKPRYAQKLTQDHKLPYDRRPNFAQTLVHVTVLKHCTVAPVRRKAPLTSRSSPWPVRGCGTRGAGDSLAQVGPATLSPTLAS